MMETKEVYEMLVFSSALTQLIAWEDFNTDVKCWSSRKRQKEIQKKVSLNSGLLQKYYSQTYR
jgi:hypothetical protein